jgi:hypothetical protein
MWTKLIYNFKESWLIAVLLVILTIVATWADVPDTSINQIMWSALALIGLYFCLIVGNAAWCTHRASPPDVAE